MDSSSDHFCSFVPSYVLRYIEANPAVDPAVRAKATRTIETSVHMRLDRVAPANATPPVSADLDKKLRSLPRPPDQLYRVIYSSGGQDVIPGTLTHWEGNPKGQYVDSTHDGDEVYENLGIVYNFYKSVFNRNSIDDKGMRLMATVHWKQNYANAIWDGNQLVFGTGNDVYMNDLTDELDVVTHEVTHGVVQHTCSLKYEFQSGALNEHLCDAFASMCRQWRFGQSASQADWLIAVGLMGTGVNGVALRSMKQPGTAYKSRAWGDDLQTDHMSRFKVMHNTSNTDFGGVHINSGIPNRAFYLAAIGLGGNSWDRLGQIWYRSMLSGKLSNTATFQDFANLTCDKAQELYGAGAREKVQGAWAGVGINYTGNKSNSGNGLIDF